jgi:hypothetical protein
VCALYDLVGESERETERDRERQRRDRERQRRDRERQRETEKRQRETERDREETERDRERQRETEKRNLGETCQWKTSRGLALERTLAFPPFSERDSCFPFLLSYLGHFPLCAAYRGVTRDKLAQTSVPGIGLEFLARATVVLMGLCQKES